LNHFLQGFSLKGHAVSSRETSRDRPRRYRNLRTLSSTF
jgi:hypothetical protein